MGKFYVVVLYFIFLLVSPVIVNAQTCNCESTHDYEDDANLLPPISMDELTSRVTNKNKVMNYEYIVADPGVGNSVDYLNSNGKAVVFDQNANDYVGLFIKSGTVNLDLDFNSNANGIKKIEVAEGATLNLYTANPNTTFNKVQIINNGVMTVQARGGVNNTKVTLANTSNWLFNNNTLIFNTDFLDVRDGTNYTNSGVMQVTGGQGNLQFSNTGSLCLKESSWIDVKGYITSTNADRLKYYGSGGSTFVRIRGNDSGNEITGNLNGVSTNTADSYDDQIFFGDPNQNFDVCTSDGTINQKSKNSFAAGNCSSSDYDLPSFSDLIVNCS